MTEIQNNRMNKILLSYAPIILLFVSVLNEFDFNFLGVKYLSFNFSYILIFFWSLKNINHFGYGMIFLAGVINDVVIGLPLGLSSLSFLLLCGATAYLRNITLRPSLLQDWFYFLIITVIINSIVFIVLDIFFSMNLEYYNFLINIFFTFLMYPLLSYFFTIFFKNFIGIKNVE
jgi:cell shape-determining protein MreD